MALPVELDDYVPSYNEERKQRKDQRRMRFGPVND
jgi:hypothetical protein